MNKKYFFVGVTFITALAITNSGCGTSGNTLNIRSATSLPPQNIYTCPGPLCPVITNPNPPPNLTEPQVTFFSPSSGVVNQIPTQITVQFSESINPLKGLQLTDWNIVCNQNTTQPLSLDLITDSQVRVTLSQPTGLTAGNTCHLLVPSNIEDLEGNKISGHRIASYQLAGGNSGSGLDQTPPTGQLTSIMDGDRLFGKVRLIATASDVGSGTLSGIERVEFYVGSWKIADDVSAPYDVTIDTALYFPTNGATTLSITVIDKAGNRADHVDLKQVTMANHTLQWTPVIGGSGGNFYISSAPAGYNLTGIEVWADKNSDQMIPLWKTAFGTSIVEKKGAPLGSQNGSLTTLRCPVNSMNESWRVVGLFGVADSKIKSLGILCQRQDGGTQATYRSSTVGQSLLSGLTPFEIQCPSGLFVTQIKGRGDSRIDQIQLGCK